jgi:hypothetical protein
MTAEMRDEFAKMHASLDRISANIPSTGFIIFWMAVVPVLGFFVLLWFAL